MANRAMNAKLQRARQQAREAAHLEFTKPAPRNPREPAAWSPPHAAGNIHHRPPPSPTRISGEEVPISLAFLWPVARARTAPSARCCTVTWQAVGYVVRYYEDGPTYAWTMARRIGGGSTDQAARSAAEQALAEGG
jgi:hypothetical protein